MNHTICALSTPYGIGGIAVVRVSGPDAFPISAKILSKKISDNASHTAHLVWAMNGDEKVDEVVATIYRSPKSFTGEDTVEIACHGSVFIQQKMIELLLAAGAQLAQPGEFTMRSYLNGKMDLSQAEAVADLIASESRAAHKQALHQMRGGFSKDINVLRERLIHFASMVELELDFAEEDVEFANREQFSVLLSEILNVVESLRESFALGNALKNGVPVAILGAPNAGKSTLLNALLNEERAIVSEIAGTTRDTVEDHITLGGIRFNFIDTAGIRLTDDAIEKMGIERAFAKAKNASVILLLFDAANTTASVLNEMKNQILAETDASKHIILLANKVDVPNFSAARFEEEFATEKNVIRISAKNKLNIERLKSQLLVCINNGKVNSGETIVTNARHHQALTHASASLQSITQGLEQGVTGDLLAVDIRKTLYHLGEITGQISADNLLHNIFSKFCIGK
ncbi:MAG: tRNA uridine-5-carboxymethylaminomethyl(34) synthesis GTPase MnmE [Flavobacteriales bacterium]